MSPSVSWFLVRWPRLVTSEQLEAALVALHGLSGPVRRQAVLLEVAARPGCIEHRLRVPPGRADGLRRQLLQAVPGLSLRETEPPALAAQRAWSLRLSTLRRPLDLDRPAAIAAALLSALDGAAAGEQLALQWWLGPARRPIAVPSGGSRTPAPSWLARLLGVVDVAPVLDAESRRALVAKQGRPGWRAVGRLAVQATGRPRQLQLLGHLSAALRTAQGPGVALSVRPARLGPIVERRTPWCRNLALNVSELTAVGAFPIGDTGVLPVLRQANRPLPPLPAVPSGGRIVGTATYPGAERPLGLSVAASLQHLQVIGPTGVGKSTLLLNLIVQDIRAGRGVVVIEPKGDLVADVLGQVPPERAADVVVIDPADAARPVGLNPLARVSGPPELVVDQLLAVFKGLFGEAVGPRSQDILAAGLLTLARRPGSSLVLLPLLFSDAAFRRQMTAGIRDPLGLGSFWAWYEGISAAERAAVLAPVMNKLRAFLLRPSVRGIIGQSQPRLDLGRALAKRQLVLVSLAKGLIGPESAALLGSLVFAQLWQALLGRGAITPQRRQPVLVYIDEFQDYLHVATDLADLLAQSRSLGVGLTLAHQHLAQLTPVMRAAVLSNARSRVVFQTAFEDANLLTRGHPELTPADIISLGAYAAYAQLVAAGRVGPYASIRTAAPPPTISDPDKLRAGSRQRFGVPAAVLEEELQRLISGQEGRPADGAIGRRQRRPHSGDAA